MRRSQEGNAISGTADIDDMPLTPSEWDRKLKTKGVVSVAYTRSEQILAEKLGRNVGQGNAVVKNTNENSDIRSMEALCPALDAVVFNSVQMAMQPRARQNGNSPLARFGHVVIYRWNLFSKDTAERPTDAAETGDA
jgi:hypothetical protein